MTESIRIPGYTLETVLGKGAMATVYQAVQEKLERKVALKLMARHLSANSEYHERFLNEAKNIAKLNHPNVITIHEVDIHESHYYIAMEYLSGGTLQDRIEKGGIDPEQALKILQQVAGALDCAHRNEIVHRDVKPANILFRDDKTAVLSDFGIAKKLNDEGANLTQAGFVIGTPTYLSPEQAASKPLDERSDLYSLGVVFYEMLTGEPPYKDNDTRNLVMMHLTAPTPTLPPHLRAYQRLVDRLMAKNPQDRFQSAVELIEAINDLPSQLPTEVNPGAAADATVRLAPSSTVSSNYQPPPATDASNNTDNNDGSSTRIVLKTILTLLIVILIGGAAASFMVVPELKCMWQPLAVETAYFYRAPTEKNMQTLAEDSIVNSGDEYRIQFTAKENAYVYVFQIDSSDTIYQLFPLQEGLGVGSEANFNPVNANRTYYVPDEDKTFALDDVLGKEHIYVVGFRQQNLELESLVAQLDNARDQQNETRAKELQDEIVELLNTGGCTGIEPLDFQHR